MVGTRGFHAQVSVSRTTCARTFGKLCAKKASSIFQIWIWFSKLKLGNIKSKFASLGGKLKGNVNSDQISIKKTANIEGVLNQKTLSIQEGAQLARLEQ